MGEARCDELETSAYMTSYVHRELSFDELRLVMNAMPVIRPLILLNLLCVKGKKRR